MLYPKIQEIVDGIDLTSIPDKREEIHNKLAAFIQNKIDRNEAINLNFICTHNSRRSHLSQIWAQTMAAYFKINNVFCYSGGTEATAMFPKVGETLSSQGFEIAKLSEGTNPVYSVKYSENDASVIAFSKEFGDDFNPKSEFAAIMTCSSADEGCPFVIGCDKRIAITYEDPKISDGTPNQTATYLERSLQIAAEMKYVFSNVN